LRYLTDRCQKFVAGRVDRFQAGRSGVEHNQPSVANALLTVACTNAMSPHFPTDAKRNIVSANRQCTPDTARDAKASEIAGNDCATDTKGDGRLDAMATCNGCENKKSFKVTSPTSPCLVVLNKPSRVSSQHRRTVDAFRP
jgi:hypothetical protein